jgi:CRP-like cAMP-binding protein
MPVALTPPKNVAKSTPSNDGQTPFFHDLPEKAKRVLRKSQMQIAFPQGAVVFSEGQAASGVFFLVKGRIRLSVAARKRKTINLRIVKPGEIFGLNTTVSGEPHRVTAVADAPSEVFFIRREDFIPFIHAYPEAALGMVECMSKKRGAGFEQVRPLY